MGSFNKNSCVDKSISRVLLHEQLEQFLKNGGAVQQVPSSYYIDNPKRNELTTELKTYEDLEDEFNPDINKQIIIDKIKAAKLKVLKTTKFTEKNENIQSLSKSAIKPESHKTDSEITEDTKPVTQRSESEKKSFFIISDETKNTSNNDETNSQTKPTKTQNTPSDLKSSDKLVKTQTKLRTKSTKAKRSCTKAKLQTPKSIKTPKIRTRSKSPEALKENHRRSSVTKAKLIAIEQGNTLFTAECRIHGFTTYTLSGSDSTSCRCLECQKEGKERSKTQEERNVTLRLEFNKKAANLAIKNGERIFIGMCAYHGKSPLHIDIRTSSSKVKYEYRCAECKKMSKFKYFLNQD